MATLNIPQNGKAVKGRTQKPLPRVDLTAMVDLAFLLITFFMLTTSLSKMKVMNIVEPVPAEEESDFLPYPETRTMTVLLGKNNQVVYYLGNPATAEMRVASMSEIQHQLLEYKKQVAATHVNLKDKEMLMIIKPTDKSTYKNFVDMIDEIHISGIGNYNIDDKQILAQENTFMKMKGI